jgi:DHA1 family bicyclomycin/chloramphenicol resistance-like MFS transporter
MVFFGSTLQFVTICVQAAVLLSGYLSPLVLFVPGFFTTLSQGLSLPFGQAAAMSVNPRLAGMAAGIGVFMQNFCGAGFTLIYGFLSNGTTGPLVMTTAITSGLCFTAGSIPLWLRVWQRTKVSKE